MALRVKPVSLIDIQKTNEGNNNELLLLGPHQCAFEEQSDDFRSTGDDGTREDKSTFLTKWGPSSGARDSVNSQRDSSERGAEMREEKRKGRDSEHAR